MSRKNRTAAVRRYLAIASQEIAPAMRLATVCAVLCGIAILIALIYVDHCDNSLVGGVPFFLFTAYIIFGIGIGLAAFSYLSKRETDVFYKLLPTSPFFTAVLKTVLTLVFCSAFIAVTVYTVYEISGFVTPIVMGGYGYVNVTLIVKGGAYGLLELKGTLLAFYYGFSVGAFCATVFSRTVVAVIHTVPFLAFKFGLGVPTAVWFLDRSNYWSSRDGLSPAALFSPEFMLVGIGMNRGHDYRLAWLEEPLTVNGLVILSLALLLIVLRRGEHSGRVLADSAFYPVYAFPLSFGTATVLEYLLGTFNGTPNELGWVIRYLTVSAVLFLIIGFLFERSIKKWRRVVTVGGTVFLIAFVWYAVMILFPKETREIIASMLK